MNRDLSAYDKQITKSDIIEYGRTKKGIFRGSPELQLILIAFASFFLLPILAIYRGTVDSSPYGYLFFGFIFFFITVFGISIWAIYSDIVRTRIYLEQVTRANGLSYFPDGLDNQTHSGFIFNLGHSRKFRDTMTCSVDVNYEISNYRYSVGSGRDKKTIDLGYVMVKINRKLPHMVLDSIKNNFNLFGLSLSNLPVSFKKDQVLSLEGDFDKYFKLYAPKDYETDALYIFNPLLMALFIDESRDYDAEIVDDCLYVYSSKPFNFKKRETLERVFQVIDTVMVKTTNTTKRYHDERTGSGFNSNVIHASGVKLRRGLRWLPILVFILYCIFILTRMFVN